MINTNNRISPNSQQSTGVSQSHTSNSSEKISSSKEQASSDTKISSLAQELAEAQVRADRRDASLDRQALADKAKSLERQLFGSNYERNKARHDAEVPKSNDPSHIKRAEQATAFSNGRGNNPFSGFSPDQLTLIIYDESGTFTTNERRAALSEQGKQEYAWRASVVAEINRQWDQRHGDISEALEGIKDHFNTLPAIEEAQISSTWRQDIQNNIRHAKAYAAKEKESESESFLETILKEMKEDFEEDKYRL